VARKYFKLVLAFFLVFSVILTQPVFAESAGSGTNGSSISSDAELEYLRTIMDMIREKYNGEVSEKQLVEGAIKGMFGTMDPYTTYFTLDEAQKFLNSVGGTYSGVGIMVSKNGDYVEVVKVMPASPAEKAGLLQGDKIVSIDGRNTLGISLDEAQSLLIGDEGTSVTLGILRSDLKETMSIEVIRELIKINPVTSEIRNGIGYIKLDAFNANAEEGVVKALEEMDKSSITRIVLDLRGNPGGEVEQAVAIAKNFVPKGLITRLDFKSDRVKDTEYYSNLGSLKYKLAVLVDEMSASASEIFAGAVQDTKSGTLVGTKSFGKAKVQTMTPLLTPEAYEKYEEKLNVKVVDAFELINVYRIMPLNNEILGWSKITVGTYTTPSGRMIDGIGLVPDVQVENPQPVNDIVISTIQKLPGTAKPSLNSEGYDVYNAEKLLKALGYDVDKPDTLLDEKTYKAISKFRTDNKLYPGGILDFTTQKVMNTRLEELVYKTDKQYQKAVEILSR
jgi:carboxyl-terminal processing protease